MPVLSDKEFQIGLTMSGAISAGAYTAGVLDFLIEALDAWEDARNGANADTVPNHRVGIKVMSGASAGAIISAIAAIALAEAEQGSTKPRAPGSHVNGGFTYRYHLPKLYEAWVVKPAFVADTAGATDLLSTSDLDGVAPAIGDFTRTSGVPVTPHQKNVVASILNTRLLDEIAAGALDVKAVIDPPRAYVSDNLHVYLTLSNLRGVPYKIEFSGGDYHMISHGDRVHYAIQGVGGWSTSSEFADDDKHRLLSARDLPKKDKDGWKDYAICALASSAFPIGLSPRRISTTLDPDALASQKEEYGRRKFPNPNLIGNTSIVPDWQPPEKGQLSYWFTSADGGIIDNDPFEYAHFALKKDKALGDPITREPNSADRAVIMISPFPEAKPILAEGRPALDIVSLATSLLPALIDQARFKPDQLALALDENVGSRYLIGPRRSNAEGAKIERYAISSGLLSGFGGFLSREFRDFDYQLGRRNCQKFLRSSFAVPADNPIVTSWGANVDRAKFLAEKSSEQEPPAYVLIPLFGSAAADVALPNAWPQISRAEFDVLMERIAARFDAVAPALIQQSVSGALAVFFRIALSPIANWPLRLIRDKALDYAKHYIMADLVRRDQIKGWELPPIAGISDQDLRLALAELLNPEFDLRNVAGVFNAIRPVADDTLTKAVLAAALDELKTADGEPFQVWEAGWKDKTPAGQEVTLYTLVSRKPAWALAEIERAGFLKPTADPPEV